MHFFLAVFRAAYQRLIFAFQSHALTSDVMSEGITLSMTEACEG